MNLFACSPPAHKPDAATVTSCEILQEITGAQTPQHVRIRLWNGLFWPNNDPKPATLVLHHPGSLRSMFLPGTETGLAEAYLHDDFDVEGDLEAAFEFVEILRSRSRGWTEQFKIHHLLRQLPDPVYDRRSVSERRATLDGRRHSPTRDRHAIQFHYDVSNDFYALWLDPRMVYSCAYFRTRTDTLEAAQLQKLDLTCRKLELQPGQRLLDIGCGWGGLLFHAVARYGVSAVGITLSERQAEFAREHARQFQMEDRVEIRVLDYRELAKTSDLFDAVVSIGMVEHVGREHLPRYFETVHRLLKPGGAFLNHGIGTGLVPIRGGGENFIHEYVFPDTDLFPLAEMLRPVEAAGFEIRDVENLREHYGLTLRHWVQRLEDRHADALGFVSETVYRIWRLYMAASAHGFNTGQLAVYQTVLSKLDPAGKAHRPLTREGWYC